MRSPASTSRAPALGLRTNLGQFSLLVGVNALVGGMVGQERAVLPLLASDVFLLDGIATALTFIVAFGAVKAATNLVAGALMDRIGRKPVLIAGWLAGIPVPLLLIWAPSWSWVIVANVFLGVNQGLCWSATVVMKIDLVGPARRGAAMGFNEAAGYGAMALTAMATGLMAEHVGLRTAPFLFGLAFAGLGLGASTVFVRETREYSLAEAGASAGPGEPEHPPRLFLHVSARDRAMSSACLAGFVNNLNDGVAWGIFPLFFASRGASLSTIGVLAAIYPAVWGAGQIATGALSDRIGRKGLIVAGMGVQALGIAVVAWTSGFAPWAAGSVLLGAGTAMAYPTLLAAVADRAQPSWRGSALGIYRLWRDAGFAAGALAAGVLADAVGMSWSITATAALTAGAAAIVHARMTETTPRDAG